MSIIRLVLGTLLALTTYSSCEAAPAKKRQTAPAAKKPTNGELLANQLIRNSYQIGEDLGATCRRTKFAYLATVLDLNAGLLTSQKGEFETDQQYQERSAKLAGVMAGDSIAICEPLNDNPDIEFRYDTENQRFSGSFSAGGTPSLSEATSRAPAWASR